MTNRDHLVWIGITSVVLLGVCVHLSYSCNEMVCASVVSKCMLTQSCKCDLKNCSCCKECFNCLSYLYSECCSCVEMCPKPNETKNALSKKSHVEELEGVPGLFNALTDEADIDEKWTIFTFPVDFDAALYGAKLDREHTFYVHSSEQDLESVAKTEKNIVTLNCTVAYLSQCMSWNKCKDHCNSMGATSYRWFHDGCCECVGSTCINYGINESRCLMCPESKEDDFEEMPSEDELDYGEGMGPIDGTLENNM
ncbi:protein twisted gastrulation [Lutzomyia longipalpis]|nr:protein twisted gastrulation [Lutzomyia longipalpis]